MKVSKSGRIAGILIILAAIEVVVMILVAQHLYPGYSLSNNYISDLGVGGTASIFNGAMVVFGILLLASSFFILRSGHRYISFAFALTAIGGMCVGIFPETTGVYHILSAMVTFSTVSVAALLFYRVYKKPLVYYSIISGLLGLFVMVLFSINLTLGTGITLGLGHGGIEEILFYNEILWALIAGVRFLTARL